VPVAAEIARQVSGELDVVRTAGPLRRASVPPGVASRVAIVVNDGSASEKTTLAGLRAVRQQDPELLLLATPVRPEDRMGLVAAVADETICLGHQPELPAEPLLARRRTTSSALRARLLRWARRAATTRV
jgi:predicted phosphoribosyltransferase